MKKIGFWRRIFFGRFGLCIAFTHQCTLMSGSGHYILSLKEERGLPSIATSFPNELLCLKVKKDVAILADFQLLRFSSSFLGLNSLITRVTPKNPLPKVMMNF